MADKTSYPMITQQRWWALRNRFRTSVPSKVTPSYLHSVLGISEQTATKVEIPLLKRLALVDPDGTTSDLARRWRDDEQYAAVCALIREAIYPEELLHAVPDPTGDEQAAVRWFMNGTGAGEQAARSMARTYRLLSEGDPASGNASAEKQRAAAPKPARVKEERAKTSRTEPTFAKQKETQAESRSDATAGSASTHATSGPSLHIDIQIHIAADANPAQIDQIFASMAKHLYSRNDT